MMKSVQEFYSIARTDDEIISALSAIQDEAVFIETVDRLAREKGFILTVEDIKYSISNFQEVIQNVANDDELTDFELEMVAAGNPPVCSENTIES